MELCSVTWKYENFKEEKKEETMLNYCLEGVENN